jgi:hypothetical protein
MCGYFLSKILKISLSEFRPLPSASRFAECFFSGTRQCHALGKDGFADALCVELSLPSATLDIVGSFMVLTHLLNKL